MRLDASNTLCFIAGWQDSGPSKTSVAPLLVVLLQAQADIVHDAAQHADEHRKSIAEWLRCMVVLFTNQTSSLHVQFAAMRTMPGSSRVRNHTAVLRYCRTPTNAPHR